MDYSYGWQRANPERSSRMEPESALEPGFWRKNAAQNMIFLSQQKMRLFYYKKVHNVWDFSINSSSRLFTYV